MIPLLSIDGRNLIVPNTFNRGLDIIQYSPYPSYVDSSATGRTEGYGQVLVRDPQSYFHNFEIVIAHSRTDNPEFVYFIQKHRELGQKEFIYLEHCDPLGYRMAQNAYYVIDKYDFVKFDDGFIYTSQITARFIFERGW